MTTLLGQTIRGAVAGAAGTLAIQGLLAASQKWFPEALPPLRTDPGEFMVEKAEERLPASLRRRIPIAVDAPLGKLLGLGYGVFFGALYGVLRPRGGSPVREGIALGALTWAAGYLGWLPALGLMPPVWRQKPAQAAGPALDHLAYGVTAVAAYDLLASHG